MRIHAGCSPISKNKLLMLCMGVRRGCGHDSSKDRPAPIVPLCGTGLPASQWGQVLPALWPRLPLRGSLASSNKFDQYGNPNTGTEHPSYQAVRRGCQRDGAGGRSLRGSGGATPCQGAASRRRAGRPGGRQKREARHCLFHYPPAGGLNCIELRSIW